MLFSKIFVVVIFGFAVAISPANAADIVYKDAFMESTTDVQFSSASYPGAQAMGDLTITADGSTKYCFEAFSSVVSPNVSGNQTSISLYDGTTRVGTTNYMAYTSVGGGIPMDGQYCYTPSSGSHTYKVRGISGAGTTYWNCSGGFECFFLIYHYAAAPSSGASTLHDLTDVNDAGKVDTSILKYNSATSKWIVGTDATGSGGSYTGPSSDTFENDTRWIIYALGITLGFGATVYGLHSIRRSVFGRTVSNE